MVSVASASNMKKDIQQIQVSVGRVDYFKHLQLALYEEILLLTAGGPMLDKTLLPFQELK